MKNNSTVTVSNRGRKLELQRKRNAEIGPTIVGDEKSDPELMEYVGAKRMTQLGNDFPEYRSDDPPRIILNKLEEKGYRVVAMAGIGQTCIWTLHKPE